MTLSPRPGVGWPSGSPSAPGSGVNITRQRGVSLDASTRNSSSGTSMSISSNSKLKAALTWAVHTTPAVALFSRPTRLRSSRSARVIFSRRWQPAMAHLTGTFLGISPILQRQLEEGGGHASRVFSVGLYLGCGVGKSLHPSSPGQRLAPRKGPLNAENAVRTTGLLTGGRNPGDGTGPTCRTVVIPDPRRIRAVKYSVTTTGHPARKCTLNVCYRPFSGTLFYLGSTGLTALPPCHNGHDEPQHDGGRSGALSDQQRWRPPGQFAPLSHRRHP